jgi:hypothetical protein
MFDTFHDSHLSICEENEPAPGKPEPNPKTSCPSRFLKCTMGSSLPPFDFAQDKLRRESRKARKDWIPTGVYPPQAGGNGRK